MQSEVGDDRGDVYSALNEPKPSKQGDVPMMLPKEFHPTAPAPANRRIETAAREICEALSAERFGRPRGKQRAVSLRETCSGFRRFGRENSIATGDYRWAVKVMVEIGLLECVELVMPPPHKDDVFELKPPESLPVFLLVSTEELWTRWRSEAPMLGIEVAGFRIRLDKSNLSVWLDDKMILSVLDEDVFKYLAVLVDSYPTPIPYEEIQLKVPTLPENQSRFNSKVDRRLGPLWRFLEIVREPGRGHFLKAPAA